MSLFSVIIPTYNRAQYISFAIKSILDQTLNDVEILVVDDGSDDDTRNILKAFSGKIKYFYQKNSGVSRARNHGIAEAKGEWVAFLDSDDEWEKSYLEVQATIVKRNKNIVASVLNSVAESPEGTIIESFEERNLNKMFSFSDEILLSRPFSLIVKHSLSTLQSAIFKRDTLNQTNLFDESISIAEDFDILAQMALMGQFVIHRYIGARIIRRNNYDSNLSSLFFTSGFKTRLSWSKVYERCLRSPLLNTNEKLCVLRAYASNERATGNLCLLNGKLTEARRYYKHAIALHPSGRSLIRYFISFLPKALQRASLKSVCGIIAEPPSN